MASIPTDAEVGIYRDLGLIGPVSTALVPVGLPPDFLVGEQVLASTPLPWHASRNSATCFSWYDSGV